MNVQLQNRSLSQSKRKDNDDEMQYKERQLLVGKVQCCMLGVPYVKMVRLDAVGSRHITQQDGRCLQNHCLMLHM